MRLVIFYILLLLPVAAVAQEPAPALIEKHDDWRGYTLIEPTGKICYLVSKPTQTTGSYVQRASIHAFITHRPTLKAMDEFTFNAGYTYKKDSSVKVDIDGRSFNLVTGEERAWTETLSMDKALVAAMKKGNNMTVQGISNQGTPTIDTFSLRGFTATYDATKAACKE